MTFQAWKMVFLNSLTFHDQGTTLLTVTICGISGLGGSMHFTEFHSSMKWNSPTFCPDFPRSDIPRKSFSVSGNPVRSAVLRSTRPKPFHWRRPSFPRPLRRWPVRRWPVANVGSAAAKPSCVHGSSEWRRCSRPQSDEREMKIRLCAVTCADYRAAVC